MTKRIYRLILICALLFSLRPSAGLAVTVYSPDVSVRSGETITVPVMIDDLDNLAGLKLVIVFDETVLTYAGGAKTPLATTFMYIVNDRQPGRLVLVMAGARGIGGKKITVFEFRFTTSVEIKKAIQTELRIVESQLMSAELKNIKHDTKPFRVAIFPTAPAGAAVSSKIMDP
ncbi:MAG: cohesin domain-containing protein [Pseudomonadota bacterium]